MSDKYNHLLSGIDSGFDFSSETAIGQYGDGYVQVCVISIY